MSWCAVSNELGRNRDEMVAVSCDVLSPELDCRVGQNHDSPAAGRRQSYGRPAQTTLTEPNTVQFIVTQLLTLICTLYVPARTWAIKAREYKNHTKEDTITI